MVSLIRTLLLSLGGLAIMVGPGLQTTSSVSQPEIDLPARAQTQIYNLADDWLSVNQPDSVWKVLQSPGVPFTTMQVDWFGNETFQIAFARSPYPLPRHVPAWMKVVLSENFADPTFVDPGTVVVHGAETDRTGTEFTSVVWTSPAVGEATIEGSTWLYKYDRRPMRWELRKNGFVISVGDLHAYDTYSKANPYLFANGIAGPAALRQIVMPGDKIELRVFRPELDNHATFVAVNLSIRFSQRIPLYMPLLARR